MTDERFDGWDVQPNRIKPLPGQRELFEDEAESASPRAEYTDKNGQRFLMDFGHGLPGGNAESQQGRFWDY